MPQSVTALVRSNLLVTTRKQRLRIFSGIYVDNKKKRRKKAIWSAKYEAYIESEADGLDISVLAVIPEEHRVLQLVHGMSEYKERYLPFMEYMAKKGYVCVIHDHRGHGKSVRPLDDLGYMYGGGADAILKDIEVVGQEITSSFGSH